MLPMKIPIRTILAVMTYNIHVLFLRHMMSNKTYDVCMFSKFINFVPIDLKIGTHINWIYIMYLAKII